MVNVQDRSPPRETRDAEPEHREGMDRAAQIRRYRDALLKLAQIDKSDPQDALASILATTAQALDVDMASYWSWKFQARGPALREEIRFSRTHGHANVDSSGEVHSAARHPRYFQALAEARVVLADDALVDDETRELVEHYLLPRGVRALLDVAVYHQGVIIGVLRLESCRAPRRWTLREMDFSNSVAIMVSLAFEAATRTRMHAALTSSEQRYRTLVENASDAIVLMDGAGNLLDVNPYMTELTGYPWDELTCMNVRELVPGGEDGAGALPFPSRPGGQARATCKLRHRNGRMISADITARALDDGQVLAVLHDVSSHARAQEELRRAGADLRVILESVYDAVFTAELSTGALLDANQNALRMFGLDPAQLGRLTLAQLGARAEDSPALHQAWDRAQGGHPELFEWSVRNCQGEAPIPAEVFLTRISLFNRDVMLCNVRDVTERKRVEAEIQRALEREKELSRLKTAFVSMISHEFRTPLSVIMSSSELLDAYLDSWQPDKRQAHFGRIRDAVRTMTAMLEHILLMGRAEAGMMEFHPGNVDVERMCRELVELTSDGPEGDRVTLRFSSGLRSVHADETLLRHALGNLLSNALKYSPGGEDVELDARREGDTLVFKVTDRGIGIPEQDRARLFDSFHRGSNVGRIHGTGLGLAIVQKCVVQHGGSVAVESEPGRGSTFTVQVPIGRSGQ